MTAPDQSPRPSRAPMSGRAIVQSQFDRAADLINLEAYMRKILMSPLREVQVEVPVRMDDGRIEVFTGTSTCTSRNGDMRIFRMYASRLIRSAARSNWLWTIARPDIGARLGRGDWSGAVMGLHRLKPVLGQHCP